MSSRYITPYQSPSVSSHHPFCACLSEPQSWASKQRRLCEVFQGDFVPVGHLLKQRPQHSQSHIRKQNSWAPAQYRQAQVKYIVPVFSRFTGALATWMGRTTEICSNGKSFGECVGFKEIIVVLGSS